ncbi:MAG: AAA family ATPase [Bacteroidales bacterium]|nr:AAA family ATPase [Bacteroidales bacterium]
METLFNYSSLRLNKTSLNFNRYLLDEAKWGDKLIGIRGARGVGKTTLMLQRLKAEYGNSGRAIYVSLDNFYFTKHRLFEFAENFHLNGGEAIFIDEVHRYPNWSTEIKNLYDLYDDLKIVFSGSSALRMYKTDGDLSRRAAIYSLQELSFREYLELAEKKKFKTHSLEDILKNHIEIASEIIKKIKIIPLFKKYLKVGAYPFFKETKGQFYDRIISVINTLIENDLQIIEGISYQTAYKLRQLVAVLADSVPFKINIAELSRKINMSRDMLLELLHSLDRANLIKALHREGSAMGYFTKPAKIYLNNTALLYALSTKKENMEGTVRETFFMNQLSKDHKIKIAKSGDFLIDEKYIFEVGGRKKGFSQIAGIKNSFIAADDIEIGFGNKIPLWLFGFMY